MAASIVRIESDEQGWVIRQGTVVTAHCADREAALQLAFALARGEHARSGEEVRVETLDGEQPSSGKTGDRA